jgi:predicted naringenin-chalcone synthase
MQAYTQASFYQHSKTGFMSVYIHHIATTVPENAYTQEFMRDIHLHLFGDDRRTAMILRRIYGQSGINARRSVVSELKYAKVSDEPSTPERFHSYFPDNEPDYTKGGPFEPLERCLVNPQTGETACPETGERNLRYKKEARELFLRSTHKLFEERPDLDPKSITHIITVSCTGFYAPGPDLDILNDLGLPLTTQRFHIGFMSCFAGLAAMRMAKTICEADAAARVLLVSTELCTLHLRFRDDIDSILSNSVFADGSAAVFVSAQSPAQGTTALEVDTLVCTVAPEAADKMEWTVGNHGFDMILSAEIPDLIELKIAESIAPLMQHTGLTKEDIGCWAIHPGGRAIVDKVAKAMELDESMVVSSRKTLHEYGNMSSATIFFVLAHAMANRELYERPEILALTFGPGLSVESGLMRLV